jgi:CBS domain containing-hemolysin-like protein
MVTELLGLALVVGLLFQLALNLWRGVLEEEPWILLAERPEQARPHWAALSFWETVAEGVFLFALFFLLRSLSVPLSGQLLGVGVAIVVLGFLKPLVQSAGMSFAASIVPFVQRVLPLVRGMELPWRFLLRWRRRPDPRESELARQELTAVVETARREGALQAEEYRLVTNLMRLRNIRLGDIMTPRTVMVSCPVDIPVRDALRIPELRVYSRIPVWEGEPDTIVGYVLTKELLWAALEGKGELPVRHFVREVAFLPEHIEVDHALEAFLQQRQQLFVVVDEYGGVEGIVTLEDIMETLLGVEIVDEVDRVADLRELAKQLREERIARIRSASLGGASSAQEEGSAKAP